QTLPMRTLATLIGALMLAGCSLAGSNSTSPTTSTLSSSDVEIIQRQSLACLDRAALERQIQSSKKKDASLKKELANNLKSRRCRYLPVGSQVTVVDGMLYTREVTVAGLEDHWWILFTDTMTQEEIEDPAHLARLNDETEKARFQEMLREKKF